MTPTQIETFVDRICGLYPAAQVGRNTVKLAWKADEFLCKQDVEDGRKAISKIMATCDKFPSLKEVHNVFRGLRQQDPQGDNYGCSLCGYTGWDTGIRMVDGQPTPPYTEVINNLTYTYVVRCNCFN